MLPKQEFMSLWFTLNHEKLRTVMVRSAHPTGGIALVAAGFSLRCKRAGFQPLKHRPEACATYNYIAAYYI